MRSPLSQQSPFQNSLLTVTELQWRHEVKLLFLAAFCEKRFWHYPLQLEDAIIFAHVHMLPINVLKPIKRAIKIK